MSVNLGELKGITDAVLNMLKAQGLGNSDELLDVAKTSEGRKELGLTIGVNAAILLDLANRADLARVKGIGRVYSDLMEEAGVDTIKELALRVPANLHAKLIEINAKRQLTQRPPSIDQVANFVYQAQLLPGVLEY